MALFLRSAAATTGLARSAAAVLPRFSSTATFTVNDFKGHNLDVPSTEVETSKEELLSTFREMNVIRRMETVAGEEYRKKHIRGFLHLYSGQEAIALGMTAAKADVDTIITAYRCHGWAYTMGCSVKSILAELFGREAGCSMGKGGSMHMYTKKLLGGNGIVGAQVPVGAGAALAHQYSGDGGANISLYGDGAANQGQVFEAYNIAKLWDLPAIFVCENNKYGMGTHDFRSSASTKYYTRGDYIPGIWVDGMDFLAVKQATAFALDHAKTKGPIVMEMETYRYHGHSMSDPDTTYRTREDIKKVRQQFDPILVVKERILSQGWATEEELKKTEKEVRAEVKQACTDALASPEPSIDQLYTHIYKGEKVKDVRGCDQFTTYSQ